MGNGFEVHSKCESSIEIALEREKKWTDKTYVKSGIHGDSIEK